MRLKLDPHDDGLGDIAGIMSCDDSIIDQFLFFFLSQHVITRVSLTLPLHSVMFYLINEVPEDGLKKYNMNAAI